MITLENVQKILVTRASGLMLEARMSVVTTGINIDLQDPIGYALRRLGYNATTDITDSNLSGLDVTSDLNPLLDLAELRVLQTFVGRYTGVDITIGDRSERLNQLVAQAEKRIKGLLEAIQSYGLDTVVVDEGAIVLNYSEGNSAQ